MKTENEIIEELSKDVICEYGTLEISLAINDMEALGAIVDYQIQDKFDNEINESFEFLESSKLYNMFSSIDELVSAVALNIYNMDKEDFYDDSVDMRFEKLFYSIFDEESSYDCYSDDVKIFVDFVQKMNKNNEIVNVWHIEQNLLKNQTNGKDTIKSLCYKYFLEASDDLLNDV